MLLAIIILIIAFILLMKSADAFTDNGAKVAKLLGLSPLLIGILIFGFGTSAPEILVSSLAAIDGSTNLSIGNALGSNIINIALVLGISALVMPIVVHVGVLKKEWSVLTLATIIVWLLLADGFLGRLDGVLFIAILMASLWWLTKKNQETQNKKIDDIQIDKVQINKVQINKVQSRKTWFYLLISLLALIASAEAIVLSAIYLAEYFNISKTMIGLTLIALGTSLPELAVAISAAFKKQHDMIIGNIIGSNLFNTLAVMAMPALIYPNTIDPHLLERDYPVVFGLTLLLFLVAYKRSKPHQINRFGGFILILTCFCYVGLLAYGY